MLTAKPTPPPVLTTLYQSALEEIRQHELRTTTLGDQEQERIARARQRLHGAYYRLRNPRIQHRLRLARLYDARPVTRTVRCPIDIAALTAYADTPAARTMAYHSDGSPYGRTHAEIARDFVSRVTDVDPEDPSTGWVVLRYAHSAKGAQLVAAGMVDGSREYVVKGEDPFRLPKRLRKYALHRFGIDVDDSAAYPRAGRHLIPVGAGLVQQYLTHRDPIMHAAGEALLPHVSDAEERRDRIKLLFNGVEMHMHPDTWRTKQRPPLGLRWETTGGTIPTGCTELRADRLAAALEAQTEFTLEEWANLTVPELHRNHCIKVGAIYLRPSTPRPVAELPDRVQYRVPHSDRPQQFHLKKYVEAQPARTAWLAEQIPRALAYIKRIHDLTYERRKVPERTLKSYVLQEAEARSRNAKIDWAREGGHAVYNLQHDGVVIGITDPVQAAAAAQALTRVCRRACGYSQPVEVKSMKPPRRTAAQEHEDEQRRQQEEEQAEADAFDAWLQQVEADQAAETAAEEEAAAVDAWVAQRDAEAATEAEEAAALDAWLEQQQQAGEATAAAETATVDERAGQWEPQAQLQHHEPWPLAPYERRRKRPAPTAPEEGGATRTRRQPPEEVGAADPRQRQPRGGAPSTPLLLPPPPGRKRPHGTGPEGREAARAGRQRTHDNPQVPGTSAEAPREPGSCAPPAPPTRRNKRPASGDPADSEQGGPKEPHTSHAVLGRCIQCKLYATLYDRHGGTCAMCEAETSERPPAAPPLEATTAVFAPQHPSRPDKKSFVVSASSARGTWIQELYVAQGHRGKGVSTYLAAAAAGTLAARVTASPLALQAERGNTRAREVYTGPSWQLRAPSGRGIIYEAPQEGHILYETPHFAPIPRWTPDPAPRGREGWGALDPGDRWDMIAAVCRAYGHDPRRAMRHLSGEGCITYTYHVIDHANTTEHTHPPGRRRRGRGSSN